MYIHMFAFRWKPSTTADQKAQALIGIRNLQGNIPGLLETWAGTNISPRGQGYELGGVMKFQDKVSLDPTVRIPHTKRWSRGSCR